jgi:histone-binding protein RBBP4
VQRLVIGTHTSNSEPNNLIILKARLPLPESSTSDIKDKSEIVNTYSKVENKIEIETRINHQGEVNKVRIMPQKYNIMATKTPSGEVHIFDYFKHPPKPTDSLVKPEMRLLGHNKEGYGLNWSCRKQGFLISGADDHRICIWDVNQNSSSINPCRTIDEHSGVVEDVCWSKQQENMFASCGDDRKLMLWDYRQEKPVFNIEAHSQEVNSVEFNHFNEFLLISGSNDKTIALWDLRNLSIKLHSFDHHRNDVVSARWNPKVETLFASYSSDRRVNIWDISKIGAQQSTTDAEDGPPELLVRIIKLT